MSEKQRNFVTQAEIYAAAKEWYGKTDIDSCCLAENRLMKGESPFQKGCFEHE